MGKDEIMEVCYRKNIREIWLYAEDVLSSGVTADELLDLGEPYGGYFTDHTEKILSLGATPMKLFKLNEYWYRTLHDRSEDLPPIFTMFIEYGLDPEYVRKWVKENLSEKEVIKNAEGFRALGIRPEDYIPAYLDLCSFRCIWDKVVFENLPSIISLNDVIEHYSAKEIESQFYRNPRSGCEKFIKEYRLMGGDINLLAKKFLDAYGYPEDDNRLMVLATLVHFGATNVHANRIIDALTYRAYSYKDDSSIRAVNEYIYETLKDHADTTKLAKLKIVIS